MPFNFDAFEKSIKELAALPHQSLYDLYCKLGNDKINGYIALRIAYEMGKNRAKADSFK